MRAFEVKYNYSEQIGEEEKITDLEATVTVFVKGDGLAAIEKAKKENFDGRIDKDEETGKDITFWDFELVGLKLLVEEDYHES